MGFFVSDFFISLVCSTRDERLNAVFADEHLRQRSCGHHLKSVDDHPTMVSIIGRKRVMGCNTGSVVWVLRMV